jgi:hypothetical protein
MQIDFNNLVVLPTSIVGRITRNPAGLSLLAYHLIQAIEAQNFKAWDLAGVDDPDPASVS